MRAFSSILILLGVSAVALAQQDARGPGRQQEDRSPGRQPDNRDDLVDIPDFVGSDFNFKCPERNGYFRDTEQCDLYYACEDGFAKAELCSDGLLFDDSDRNRERCKLPYRVDCGSREFVQEPEEGIDPRCPHANGHFDFADPTECSKFVACSNGVAFEQPCAPGLHFDINEGNCGFKDRLSADAKVCTEADGLGKLKTVEGFTCPGKETFGPNGLLQAHPVFPHPSDCQFFFTCFFGKEPNKFGCSKGQVFDAVSQTCKLPEEVSDCSCWYDCGEDSDCPETCNADCSCPAPDQLLE